MLFLLAIKVGSFDFSTTASRTDTIIILLLMITVEILVFLKVDSKISMLTKEREDFWRAIPDGEKDKELPYNKKNFILRWFLCGTKDKIPVLIKILVFIKNLVFLTYCVLSIMHLIVFNHKLSLYARLFLGVLVFCELISDLPLIIRNKFKQKNKKPWFSRLFCLLTMTVWCANMKI